MNELQKYDNWLDKVAGKLEVDDSEENQIYMDSFTGHMDKLIASWAGPKTDPQLEVFKTEYYALPNLPDAKKEVLDDEIHAFTNLCMEYDLFPSQQEFVFKTVLEGIVTAWAINTEELAGGRKTYKDEIYVGSLVKQSFKRFL
jgi:hypothetical protein